MINITSVTTGRCQYYHSSLKFWNFFFEKRIRLFVDKNNVLFDGQYGFRTNRSTGFALNVMVDTIVKAIDNNKFCIGVFIDQNKVFDTVDHSLLIKKFKYYDVKGTSSKFLESYLSKFPIENSLLVIKMLTPLNKKIDVVCLEALF